MTTITTRAGKGTPLTNTEIDANFSGLNSNKVEMNVSSTASGASITPSAVNTQYNVTALAVDLTINAVSGSPVDGQRMIIRIKDAGTAKNLTWNAIYRNLGALLPTATVANKTLYVGITYNSTDTKWDVTMSVIQQ